MNKIAIALGTTLSALCMNASFAAPASSATTATANNKNAAATTHQMTGNNTAMSEHNMASNDMHSMNGPNRTAMNKLCQGKTAGASISSNSNNPAGTCQLSFSPNNTEDWSRLDQEQMKTKGKTTSGINNTNGQMKYQQLCKNKKSGQTVTTTVNGKSIKGTCQVQFHTDMPMRAS